MDQDTAFLSLNQMGVAGTRHPTGGHPTGFQSPRRQTGEEQQEQLQGRGTGGEGKRPKGQEAVCEGLAVLLTEG